MTALILLLLAFLKGFAPGIALLIAFRPHKRDRAQERYEDYQSEQARRNRHRSALQKWKNQA